MSLSPNEKEATKEEFRANIKLAGLTRPAIAADLGISAAKLNVSSIYISVPWKMRGSCVITC